jgi:hypothetical protein
MEAPGVEVTVMDTVLIMEAADGDIHIMVK